MKEVLALSTVDVITELCRP